MTLHMRMIWTTSLFSVAVVFGLIVGLIALRHLASAQAESQVTTEALRHHLEADMMHDALRSQVYQAIEVANAGDSAGLKEVRDEYDGHVRWFRKMIDANEALPLPASVDAHLANVEAPLEAYVAESSSLISRIADGRTLTHANLAQFGRNFKALEIEMRNTSDAIERAVEDNRAGVLTTTTTLQAILLIGGFLLLGLAVNIYLVVRKQVIQPIEQLTRSLARLEAGELEIEIANQDRSDEIGKLAIGLEAFKATIHERRRADQREDELRDRAESLEAEARAKQQAAMVDLAGRFEATVSDVASGVATASSQLMATALAMSATAEQSSRRTSEVSDALNEASASVTAAAAASDEFAMSISAISKQAAHSADLARIAAATTDEADTTMNELQAAADQVGQIVELIASIANQTKLLAVNASIEAARGGSAGRSFAVVASEVKDLASQTSKAIGGVSQQVGAIQNATIATVSALRAIGQKIDELATISASIALAVDQQSASGHELARSIDRAAQSTDEAAANVVNIRETSIATGGTASQVLTSSAELDEQAVALRRQVDDFLNHVRAA